MISTLYPLDTFRYDTVSLSMTISHLQIAVFLNSHLADGLWTTAMTTGGLDYLLVLVPLCRDGEMHETAKHKEM